ncbi:iron chaperone [Aminobacter sp. HY435]|uniref:iron chaperone n=1 Tax=Aminobacter sp. HY435 TaxID=2970917 RepID=UPI0022B98512|nr:DUF1801 domain-containing protein [Aminobacter sp. HY435]
MANTDFRSVDEYMSAQPEAARPTLAAIRQIIRQVLPAAEEVISYQIPAYKVDGGRVIYFSGWKEHYSLYPVTAALMQALADEIAPYVAGKGTLRFSYAEPVPARLIERIVRIRADEVAAETRAKATRPKRR